MNERNTRTDRVWDEQYWRDVGGWRSNKHTHEGYMMNRAKFSRRILLLNAVLSWRQSEVPWASQISSQVFSALFRPHVDKTGRKDDVVEAQRRTVEVLTITLPHGITTKRVGFEMHCCHAWFWSIIRLSTTCGLYIAMGVTLNIN